MADLEEELQQRWEKMFAALHAGEDVPPAQRLRTEGVMEAAAMLGIASEEALSLAMAAVFQRVFGYSIAYEFGEHWQAFFPFPQIPAMAKRAPVFPSTKD